MSCVFSPATSSAAFSAGRTHWAAAIWLVSSPAASRPDINRRITFSLGTEDQPFREVNRLFARNATGIRFRCRAHFSAPSPALPSRRGTLHACGMEAMSRSAPAVSHDPFTTYDPGPFYCELLSRIERNTAAERVRQRIAAIGLDALRARAEMAESELLNLGVTFTVYSEAAAIDRILPFDCVPRIIPADDWRVLERGVAQRVRALNLFLADIYNQRHITRDGVVPAPLVFGNANYRPEMEGFPVRFGTYVHICGIDIVRDQNGAFCVLEDNARTPSGVSYVVENRHLMLRTFPDLVSGIKLRPVDDYGRRLRNAMDEIAPEGVSDPQVVLLSPGIYNSAYFEHVFLAREMGVPLVEGADLVVEDERVWMRTTGGLRRVHTIYRRIGDDFLDPTVFRPDSMLGVPGLIGAWRRGNVSLANAVGTGVADDKAIYAYMPRIIRYYLGEDPVLPNVETHICGEADGYAYTLSNLANLVVKPVGESGGDGSAGGPRPTSRGHQAG